MKISKIKLNDGGLKGLTVTFLRYESKDGASWLTEYPGVKYKYPVQGVLAKAIQEMKKYVSELCSLTTSDELGNDNYSNVTVTGVSATDDGFVITASIDTVCDKKYTVNTPFICSKDGYSRFHEASSVIDKIFSLTDEYIAGRTIINKTQFILDLHANDDNFDTDVFKAKSEIEKEAFYMDELERRGHIILRNEEAAA